MNEDETRPEANARRHQNTGENRENDGIEISRKLQNPDIRDTAKKYLRL